MAARVGIGKDAVAKIWAGACMCGRRAYGESQCRRLLRYSGHRQRTSLIDVIRKEDRGHALSRRHARRRTPQA
jgi:hypothetical protein